MCYYISKTKTAAQAREQYCKRTPEPLEAWPEESIELINEAQKETTDERREKALVPSR
jgi:hypothetical protein